MLLHVQTGMLNPDGCTQFIIDMRPADHETVAELKAKLAEQLASAVRLPMRPAVNLAGREREFELNYCGRALTDPMSDVLRHANEFTLNMLWAREGPANWKTLE